MIFHTKNYIFFFLFEYLWWRRPDSLPETRLKCPRQYLKNQGQVNFADDKVCLSLYLFITVFHVSTLFPEKTVPSLWRQVKNCRRSYLLPYLPTSTRYLWDLPFKKTSAEGVNTLSLFSPNNKLPQKHLQETPGKMLVGYPQVSR